MKFPHSEKQKYYPIDSVIVLQSLIAVLRSPLKRFWGEDGLSLGGINEERSLCSRRLKLQPKHSSGSSKWRRAVWTRWVMLRKMGPNSVWRDTPPLFGSPCPVLHTEDNHYPLQQSLHPSLHKSTAIKSTGRLSPPCNTITLKLKGMPAHCTCGHKHPWTQPAEWWMCAVTWYRVSILGEIRKVLVLYSRTPHFITVCGDCRGSNSLSSVDKWRAAAIKPYLTKQLNFLSIHSSSTLLTVMSPL